MTLTKWLPYAVAAALLLLLAYTYTEYGAQKERAKQSAVLLAQSQDSLKVLHTSLTAAEADVAAARAKVDTVWRVRTITLASADTARRRADSLIILAGRDTAAACTLLREAYDARTSECAHLRTVVQQDSAGLRVADDALRAVQDTLISAVRQTAILRRKLDEVSKPYTCRWLPFVPCPSRTVTFIAGGVTVFGLRALLAH
ncbi:MAG TPA: hypothetical protein VM487_12985 [Phycisphaerae bacterium]|nr:hypothetical protein [Phycisphaerae bacterium]